MKNKSSHSSLDEFILEQIEGTKILHLLFNRIHKITKDTNIIFQKLVQNLAKNFIKTAKILKRFYMK